MKFEAIPGHEKLKEKLIYQVQKQRIHHAQLFMGGEGSANLALALATATYINCIHPGKNDSCGNCESCLRMHKLMHPDMHFVYPIGKVKKNKESISYSFLNEWRSFVNLKLYGGSFEWKQYLGEGVKQFNIAKNEVKHIIETIMLKPFMGKYKIVLVWLPEFMHASTANALLKNIEEPPSKTLFFWVTHNASLLLSTILSRMQKVNVPFFSDENILNFLDNKFKIPEKQARMVVTLADGNLNKALKIINNSITPCFDWFVQWMRLSYSQNFPALLEYADAFQNMDSDVQKDRLLYSLYMLREVLLYKGGVNKNLLRSIAEEEEFLTRFASSLNLEKVAELVALLNPTIGYLDRHANAKVLFMSISINIGNILRK